MASIKTISTANIPPRWEVIYELDFTEQTAAAWAGDGSGNQRTLEGIDWIAGNTGYATAVKTTTADGLVIEIDGASGGGVNSSRWYSSIQTGPIVFASLDDIVALSGVTYSNEDTIAIQTITDHTIDTIGTNGQYFYGGIYAGDGNYGATSTGLYYHNCWLGRTGPVPSAMTRYGGGGSSAGDWYDESATPARASNPFSSIPTFYELVIYPATAWAASAGTETSFPDPLSVSTFRSYGSMELQLPKDMGSDYTNFNPGPDPQYTLRPGASTAYGAAIYVGLWGAYLTQTHRDSAITCVFPKFRVLKRNK